MTPLDLLIDRLRSAGLLLDVSGDVEGREVDHLAHDSRDANTGGLFTAIHGERVDGHMFIETALANGAAAVVCEDVPQEAAQAHPEAVFVRVSDSRAAWGEMAATYFDDPSREMQMIGITGTNGKTTTTYLVHHLLTALDVEAGLIGTIEVRAGERLLQATHTTPDALELQRMLRQMRQAGCTACVMEVSSHALVQERVRGVAYDVGVFTNLTPEHLDYHGSLESYLQAKKRLFDGLPEDAAAVYNADDEAGSQMVTDTAARRLAYGRGGDADVRVQVLANRLDGLHLRLDGKERTFRLTGLFNAYNLAAAYSVGRALGYGSDVVLDALAAAPPVPGRFERLHFDDGTTVIVDYAHTADALENVLQTIRQTMPADVALWCVFGCGGDRDHSKRRTMGTIAQHYADHIVVTSDNPRSEDPEAIMNDIRRGMDRPTEAAWIVDREAAIATVAREAAPGDVVLIAGKGHETYQDLGSERRTFDDREKAKTYFARRTA